MTKTDYQLRDDLLKEWRGRRLTIQGIFEKKKETQNKRSGLVVLAQEIEVDIPDKGWHFLGHMWLQHAEELEALQNGDRFTCSCRISRYEKRQPDGIIQTFYNLVFPQQVRLATGPSSPMAVKCNGLAYSSVEMLGAVKTTPLELLAQGKHLVNSIGMDKLREVRNFLKDLGGLDKLDQFFELVKEEK